MSQFHTSDDLMRLSIVGSANTQISPASMAVTGGKIFDTYKSNIRPFRRRIQNVGTVVIKGFVVNERTNAPGVVNDFVNGEPNYATQIPHFILSAGLADDDGLGGAIELDKFGGSVYLWTGTAKANAIRAITFESIVYVA